MVLMVVVVRLSCNLIDVISSMYVSSDATFVVLPFDVLDNVREEKVSLDFL